MFKGNVSGDAVASSTIVKSEGALAEQKMVGRNIKPRKDYELLRGAGMYTD